MDELIQDAGRSTIQRTAIILLRLLDGERLTTKQISDYFGLSYHTVYYNFDVLSSMPLALALKRDDEGRWYID